jgi:protein tyrosine phosphatase (PTP) superfamily phosphohydrolase (DUF442 family)
LAAALAVGLVVGWDDLVEKRVVVVEPGRLVRGAWQRPGPFRRLLARERIRTVVTLTAINRDDPKYVAQERVVRRSGVDWVIVPMRGSRATLDQMAEAADLLADPSRRPVFFHCVAGHHRTGLVHAAYRIRHQGWSADRAWRELAALPWARPDAQADRADRRLIEAFAERCRAEGAPRKDAHDAEAAMDDVEGRTAGRGGRPGAGAAVRRLSLGDG